MRIPQSPPEVYAVLDRYQESLRADKWLSLLTNRSLTDAKGRYVHWDKLRFAPPDDDFPPELKWAGLRMARESAAHWLPFEDSRGRPFFFTTPDGIQRALHEIDSNARGTLGVADTGVSKDSGALYFQRSLIEEPFMSSVLEGAATTRAMAQKMIDENRPPKTHDEIMVLNNYHAMRFIRTRYEDPLTPAVILELHRILTKETLRDPAKCGALRTQTDNVYVADDTTNEVLHMPPDAATLPERIERLCKFANETAQATPFVHPIIRAVLLHFMLAYDHPFVDGNGRAARALFYWCALRHGYWPMEFISISSVIKRAPIHYGEAFLNVETDRGDATYFIEHQLGVIQQALVDLGTYLTRKRNEFDKLQNLVRAKRDTYNHRQVMLIQDAVKRPNARYTIEEHRIGHQVSYLTARQDLEALVKRGLFRKMRVSGRSVYAPKVGMLQSLEKAQERRASRG